MKYFATQTRPAKFEDGTFKFRKKTTFEIATDKAYKMYKDAVDSHYIEADELEDYFKFGTHVRTGVNMGASSISIWGENITDEELFKRRLAGEVASEILSS